MNKLLRYLKQPFPINNNPLMVVVISAILVVFVLAVFQPFGFNQTGNKALALLWFGATTIIGTSVTCFLIPSLFKQFYSSENWTVWKNTTHILLLLIIISIGNTLSFIYLANLPLANFASILCNFLPITILIGLFPTIIITVIIQNKALKENLKEAKELNLLLTEKVKPADTADNSYSDLITIEGNTKESIRLQPNNVLYLEASGNYINIHYTIEGSVKQKMIRETISQMGEVLKAHPQFVRCHRPFIVNINEVLNVEGNSQGYRLSLRHTPQEVPVSRSYTKIFKEHLG